MKEMGFRFKFFDKPQIEFSTVILALNYSEV